MNSFRRKAVVFQNLVFQWNWYQIRHNMKYNPLERYGLKRNSKYLIDHARQRSSKCAINEIHKLNVKSNRGGLLSEDYTQNQPS